MQNIASPRRHATKLFPLLTALIAVSGCVFTFGCALLILLRTGNPVFMLVWLGAVTAVGFATRANYKWRTMLKRMYATGAQPDRARYGKPRWEVEDVVFKELPDVA